MSKRLPVTIITGFLGTGKTTLLRSLLTKSHKRLAVMVNEFGSVGLDGDLIKSCGFCPKDELDNRIVELNNGCICCTVQEDFLPTIEVLLSRHDQLDGILIETSGLAMPLPLLKALEWPEIRSKVYVNGVVTLVDGEALLSGSPIGDPDSIFAQQSSDPNLDHLTPIDELFDDQLISADLVLISRSDLITSANIANLTKELLSKVRAGTSILPIHHGNISEDLILGINSEKYHQTSEESQSITSHDHNDGHDHTHVDVRSGLIRIEANIERKSIEELLPKLASLHQVLRIKGRIWLEGKSRPLQIQMVGPRLSSWFEIAPNSSWKPKNSGVDLICLSFKKDACELIKKELTDYFLNVNMK